MTSEKHTHNMMALSQQNAKMLQQMMQGASGDPSKLLPPLPQPGGLLAPPTSSEAALADLAFNQAVLAQMMSGGNLPAVPPSNDLNLAALMAAAQNNPEAAMAAAAAHAANQESPEALQEKQNQGRRTFVEIQGIHRGHNRVWLNTSACGKFHGMHEHRNLSHSASS